MVGQAVGRLEDDVQRLVEDVLPAGHDAHVGLLFLSDAAAAANYDAAARVAVQHQLSVVPRRPRQSDKPFHLRSDIGFDTIWGYNITQDLISFIVITFSVSPQKNLRSD